MRRYLLLVLSLIAVLPLWADDDNDDTDDFGVWSELCVEKKLPHSLSAFVSVEDRTCDNSTCNDRLAASLGLGYKINKYLKVGASYSFLDYYKPSEYTVKDETTVTNKYKTYNGVECISKQTTKTNTGYNETPSYWLPKHRINIDVTGTFKLNKWLRLSLRERYQFTHAREKTLSTHIYRQKVKFAQEYAYNSSTGQTYPVEYDEEDIRDNTSTEIIDSIRPNVKETENEHMLRTRLKLEMDRKHIKWHPYISVELHNDLTNKMSLEKVRTVLGTTYDFNSHHEVGLGYVMTAYVKEEPRKRMHALSLNYTYSF